MSMNKLEIKHINKAYRNVETLKDINLTLENGIYGLIGNNGAGKSTLLHILTTIIEPTSGEVLYDGENIKDNTNYRNSLGYVPQLLELPSHMSVKQYLFYVSSLKGIKGKVAKEKIESLLKQLHLQEKRNALTNTLSGGQKQRVLIAQSLLNDPKVLLMDEPTAGLDPIERKKLRELIVEISLDKIILITTHVISDIEYIADQVIIMKSGQICKMGNQNQIMNDTEVFESIMSIKEYEEFSKQNKVVNISSYGDSILVRHFNSTIPGKKVVTKLEDIYIKELDV